MIFINKIDSAVFNASCKTDLDCKNINNSSYLCIENKCQHKSLKFSLNEIFGLFLIILISGLCNAGGLGGGAVMIPIFSIIFNYTTPESIPMSKATILAGAMMNLILIINKRHPKNKDKSLIDFKLGSIIIPLLLGGTMIGVLLTKIFPPVLTIILLSIYLFKSTVAMYKKSKLITMEEEDFKNRLKIRNKIEKDSIMTSIGKKVKSTKKLNTSNIEETIEGNELKSIDFSSGIKEKSFIYILLDNKIEILICFLSLLIIFFSAVAKGGHGIESLFNIKICSNHYWSIYVISQILIIGCSLFSYKKNINILIEEKEGEKDYNSNLISKSN